MNNEPSDISQRAPTFLPCVYDAAESTVFEVRQRLVLGNEATILGMACGIIVSSFQAAKQNVASAPFLMTSRNIFASW